MATADQVKALVRSHAAGDESRFYSVALQVAARAARSGQNKFAQELRELIDEAKSDAGKPGRSLRPVPVTQPRGELAGLLAVSYPDLRMSDLTVEPSVRARLERVLTEQRQAERLREHGFRPMHRLLLVGSPGTGKTMTAGVLAGELRLPLFLIRLEVLITKFMGETAAKLRMVFDAVEATRGVYLFDEVDALAGDRSSANDVGEIRRVLNSFLQFLDADDSTSLIIAASNHPQLLDRAVFRRFDAVVEYPLPTPAIARDVIKQRLSALGTKGVVWKRVDEVAAGLSHAELTLACEHAAKEALLLGLDRVTTGMLVSALRERRHAAGG
ncbi:MAG: AAA family ATPase [Desertimonas sp.]